jgi:hypothetical protein
VGYFIIFNDAFSNSQLAHLIKEFEVHTPENLGLSVPPRVFQIYFALCFIAAASAVYAWRCPSVIKRHPSAGGYIADEGAQLGEYATEHLEIMLARADDQFDQFRSRMRNRISQDFTPQEAGAEVKNATLHTYFDRENQTYGLVRLAITFLYGVGFTILSIPAAKIFWKVCTVLYRLLVDHGLSAIW